MKLLVTLFATLLLTQAFDQKSASMYWMAGTWKIKTAQGYIVEKWKAISDSTLTGRSVQINSPGDSLIQEIMELSRHNAQWTFTSTVQGQNNNQPVSFKVIFAKGTEFISENPAHDFPQRIAYRRINNTLYASIEGKNNGKYRKVNFDFTEE